MRLTLRTLLAYLDDTLPASEAKSMGEKLAESEPAQEIVERIKNVIRRRRLTVAPASNRIDANTLAEYLDNEITPDLAEELERICLSSDVHLAEVSACHQILSLVLGEPPAAPEQAMKRMYGIGKGETGVTVVKPARTAGTTEKPPARQREADEALRMGLPSVFVKDWANRAMIFTFGAIACLLIVVASLQLMKKPEEPVDPGSGFAENKSAKSDKIEPAAKIDETIVPEPTKVAPKPEPVVEKKIEPRVEEKPVPPPPVPPKTVDPVPSTPENVPDTDLPPPAFGSVIDTKMEQKIASIAFDPPSTKSVGVGQVFEPGKGQISVVLQQTPKSNEWKRVAGKSAAVSTARPIVSLPGSKATITTLKGVKVTAWGTIPEMTQWQGPTLYESMVEFHDHDTLDLDMTLRRGRILISNLRDDPIVVRIRFDTNADSKGADAYWLLRLAGPNAEAMVDRWTIMPPGEPFFADKDNPERKGPVANMACLAISGTVFLKAAKESITLRAGSDANMAYWLGSDKKLVTDRLPAVPWLDAKFVPPPEVVKTRNEINNAFAGKETDVAILELMKSNDVLTRRTAVRMLGGIDDLPGLLDALGGEKIEQRDAAVETLRHWVSLSRDNDAKLYEFLRGLPRFKANEPELFMSLLHGFSQKDLARAETYASMIESLRHRQMEIRELAAWNLYRIVPGQAIPYDAADPVKREKAYLLWQKVKLPPAPTAPKTKAAVEHPIRPNAAVMIQRSPDMELAQPRNHFIRFHPLANSRFDAAATISS